MEKEEKKKRRKDILLAGLGIIITVGTFVSGYMAGRLSTLPEQKEVSALRAENAALKVDNKGLLKAACKAEYYHGKAVDKISNILETARS